MHVSSRLSQLFDSAPRKARCLSVLVLLLLCLVTVSACGKRPPEVDAPESAKTQTFPRVYPDPSTDPTP